MKVNRSFNWMFYTILLVLTMSLFVYSWNSYRAIKTIERNAGYSVDRETERSFNKWDFERETKMYLILGIIFFILTILYLGYSIDITKRRAVLEQSSGDKK